MSLTHTHARDRAAADAPVRPGSALATAIAGILDMPARFRPGEAGRLHGTWVLEVASPRSDRVDAFTVRVQDRGCTVVPGAAPNADATIRASATTWTGILSGSCDGLEAFTRKRLQVHGDLNLAVRLETLFRQGNASTRALRSVRTDVGGITIDALVAGRGTPVLLLHGLAASKVSFLPTVDGLSRRYEVHAIDLPGFGRSSKPLPSGRRYSPRWMAEVVQRYVREHDLRQPYLVGNSMGGRIAVEYALRYPHDTRGVVGLGAAVAFDEWQRMGTIIRMLQGQWVGVAPFPLRRTWVEGAIAEMFHDPHQLSSFDLTAGAEDFIRAVRNPRHRLAIVASARHLAAERANGRHSFWTSLAHLEVPSYWIWGRSDRLVNHRYSQRVRELLPDATVEVWERIGHVPQFEDVARTNAALEAFIARVEDQRRDA